MPERYSSTVWIGTVFDNYALSGFDFSLAFCRRAVSHRIQASSPSPVVLDTSRISICGCTRRAFSLATSALKGRYGSRSILVRIISSDLKKIEG